MKIKAMVIAPYAGLAELTATLQAELTDFDITVTQGDLSEVIPLLESIHEQGYDLLISRGGTAKLLRSHSHLPVIEIPISGFDILRILTLIKGYKSKIEMIGFPNIIEGFISVSSLMGMDLSYTIIGHEDEVDEALRRAKANGAKVIVGDNITVRKAAEHAMQGVLITSGRESVLEAFRQARQIHSIRKSYDEKSAAYEMLLNTMEVGYAIVDASGNIRFANDSFCRLLNVRDWGKANLYQEYPYFRQLIGDLNKGITLDQQMMLFDDERKFAVAGGEIPTGQPHKKLYYLKVRPAERVDSEIRISYADQPDQEFPHLIMSTIEFHGQGSASASPMAVYGEKGVGKRLFALNLLLSGEGRVRNTVEIEIVKASDSSFAALLTLVETAREDQILYISGAEHLTGRQQKELSAAVVRSNSRIIFAFRENPEKLKEARKLDARLYETFRNAVAYIPPLRERLNRLDEYIRTFLIAFNEKHGKQIVGLRPKVMEALYAHPWNENLSELKDMIELFVKHTDGEYVEENVLPLLEGQVRKSQEMRGEDLGVKGIDLNKTLNEIEKDIIRIVLEQENMNQSKAAKRLGINRSTLWRKLKE